MPVAVSSVHHPCVDLLLRIVTYLVGLFAANFINFSTDLWGSLNKENAIETAYGFKSLRWDPLLVCSESIQSLRGMGIFALGDIKHLEAARGSTYSTFVI